LRARGKGWDVDDPPDAQVELLEVGEVDLRLAGHRSFGLSGSTLAVVPPSEYPAAVCKSGLRIALAWHYIVPKGNRPGLEYVMTDAPPFLYAPNYS
jgi:hypothetical protein